MSYHVPVLAQECLDALQITPTGKYVDATYGGGGHSKLILQQLGPQGQLFGFDQDSDTQVELVEDPRLVFCPYNFRTIKKSLRLHGVRKVDGILADLGVSSAQLDRPERGMSYRFDGPLDMRMHKDGTLTAADIVNSYTAEELQRVLGEYGEVRNARTLAAKLVDVRRARPLLTTQDLLTVMQPLVRGDRFRYMAQVFQALRIEVNDEMGALKDLLTQSLEVLKPGGRLVVLTFHSLEDRIVKRFMKSGRFDGELDQDFYGRTTRPFKVITRKPILPDTEEQRTNPRSRSAKLRVAELPQSD